MTDLPLTATRARPRRPDRLTVLHASAAAAAGAGLFVALRAAPRPDIEGQLVLLLRFMGVVKAAMVLGALGLTHWRFRSPIAPAFAGGFIGALAAMLVAVGLIWSLQHVAAGAVLFHCGLFAFLILAWKDDTVGRQPGARLSTRR